MSCMDRIYWSCSQLAEDLGLVAVQFESDSKQCMDAVNSRDAVIPWRVYSYISNVKYSFVAHPFWVFSQVVARLMVLPISLRGGIFSTYFGVLLIFVMASKLLQMLVILIWTLCLCRFVVSVNEFHDYKIEKKKKKLELFPIIQQLLVSSTTLKKPKREMHGFVLTIFIYLLKKKKKNNVTNS